MKTIAKLLTVLFLFAGCGSHKDGLSPDPDNAGLILPEGFAAIKVADSLGQGRHITVKDNGDIYLSLRRLQDGYGAVALRDTDGDGRADVIKYFGSVSGTGIELHNGYLYYGADSMVVRYPFENYADLLPAEKYEVIAAGLVDERQHAAKPFEFDGDGNMYVTIGAPANACMQQMRTKGSPGMDPCPILEYAGGVWRFKDDVLGQDQMADGYRYSTGIRHAVALKWNTSVGKLYVVQHGRDQLHQFYPEIFTEQQNAELPAEEFLMLDDGADFGWPYCYYDQLLGLKVLAPEYGGDGAETGRCESKTDPILAFPGHMAPNDLTFYNGEQFPEKYKHGAFVAFHGSWNRAPEPQKGYFVTFVPFDGALPSGDWEEFADGFSELEQVNNPGDAVHRPCGLAIGPDGSLYVSDSRLGTIWRIFYTGSHEKVKQESASAEPVIEDISTHPGLALYNMHCLPCHQADGNGVPGMYPGLNDTKWVNGDIATLVKIVVEGMDEEIEVNGEYFNRIMAPLPHLSDQEVADILTYVRKRFGTNASEVSVSEVKSIRNPG